MLEVDHIIPRAGGGTNDPMNLATSCYDCNRGKADKNLSEIMTGEDPHDRAIELLERERQLAEYNAIQQRIEYRFEDDWAWISAQWKFGGDPRTPSEIRGLLRRYSVFDVQRALEISHERVSGGKAWIRYACGILKNWKEDGRCLG